MHQGEGMETSSRTVPSLFLSETAVPEGKKNESKLLCEQRQSKIHNGFSEEQRSLKSAANRTKFLLNNKRSIFEIARLKHALLQVGLRLAEAFLKSAIQNNIL